jgi:hypothetical protein
VKAILVVTMLSSHPNIKNCAVEMEELATFFAFKYKYQSHTLE